MSPFAMSRARSVGMSWASMLTADWGEMGGGIAEQVRLVGVATVGSGWSMRMGVTVEDRGGDSLNRLME